MEKQGQGEYVRMVLANTKAPSVAVNHSARGFSFPNERRRNGHSCVRSLFYGRQAIVSILPPARNLPARAGILSVWIEQLYTKLREAEARAAQPELPLMEHNAAVATARYIVGQIEHFQHQVYQLNLANDEPPGAGETPRRF